MWWSLNGQSFLYWVAGRQVSKAEKCKEQQDTLVYSPLQNDSFQHVATFASCLFDMKKRRPLDNGNCRCMSRGRAGRAGARHPRAPRREKPGSPPQATHRPPHARSSIPGFWFSTPTAPTGSRKSNSEKPNTSSHCSSHLPQALLRVNE